MLWLPDYMAKEHVARGELVPLFDEWSLDPMPLYLAYPPNRHVNTKLRVFIDWITVLMAQHAPILGVDTPRGTPSNTSPGITRKPKRR